MTEAKDQAQNRPHGIDSSKPWGPVRWKITALDRTSVRKIEAFPHGLFASTSNSVFRGDLSGEKWEPLQLPPQPRVYPFFAPSSPPLAVSPLTSSELYAYGEGGLHRSVDGGKTWSLSLHTNQQVLAVAVSPASHRLIYAAAGRYGDFRFFRSSNGGDSWDPLDEVLNQTLCGWEVRLLHPHPTDPNRVFRTAECYAGRNLSSPLKTSSDMGQSWRTTFHEQLLFPSKLVGGFSQNAADFYLAAQRDFRAGGSSIFVTHNDAQSWSEILSFRGGGTMQEPSVPNVLIRGLACDPVQSRKVFVGLTEAGHGVLASVDSGETWVDIASGSFQVEDLALDTERGLLYAATRTGLWRADVTKVS